MRTLSEVCDKLVECFNPEEICDLLSITSETLVNALDVIVEQNMDWLEEELFDEPEL